MKKFFNKHGRNIYLLFMLILGIGMMTGYVHAETAIPEPARIVDMTASLTDDQLVSLRKYSQDIDQQTGATFLAVIIPKLDGETIEQYGLRVAEAWRPGHKDDERSALLIISLGDHKMRIETSRVMGTTLTDSCASEIIDAMRPAMQNKDYGKAIGIFLTKAGTYSGLKPEIVAENQPKPEDSGTIIVIILLTTGALLMVVYAANTLHSRYKEQQRKLNLQKEQERRREREQELHNAQIRQAASNSTYLNVVTRQDAYTKTKQNQDEETTKRKKRQEEEEEERDNRRRNDSDFATGFLIGSLSSSSRSSSSDTSSSSYGSSSSDSSSSFDSSSSSSSFDGGGSSGDW
jgi:uncharacterized protein